MKTLTGKRTTQLSVIHAVRVYQCAKDYVIKAGFGSEVEWQQNLLFEEVGETHFLSELAWVILCTGMKEAIVRTRFNAISFCFFDWESAQKIVDLQTFCYKSALHYFNHPRKINAIIKSSERIVAMGFDELKSSLNNLPLETLRRFPFVGPITSYHLAKNLGIAVAKPDRHLVRICKASGYNDVQRFCEDISGETGDSVPVVDLVLWRYATLKKGYVADFQGRRR